MKIKIAVSTLVSLFILSAFFIPRIFSQAGQVDGWWTDSSGVNHQCPPDCGGSSSGSGASNYNSYSNAYNAGVAIWQMGQQQAERDAALLRQQELQRQEAARIARENQLRREEEQRQAHAQLMSELSLIDSPGKAGPELLPMDGDKNLKPTGTSFFGIGGDKGTAKGFEVQDEFRNMDEAWVNEHKGIIAKRLEEPNKWCKGILGHLKHNEPSLPYKKFDELQPGDVLVVNASGSSWAINKLDNLLSGVKASKASHTVLYLKEVNGKKYFLENIPGEGPRIILEDEYQERYRARGAQVARLVGQPLNAAEAKELYAAAVELAAKNRKSVVDLTVFGTNYGTIFGTDYGVWGKDDIVCSESDWALLKKFRDIPKTTDKIKRFLGVDFSPADFFENKQHFLVTPLGQ